MATFLQRFNKQYTKEIMFEIDDTSHEKYGDVNRYLNSLLLSAGNNLCLNKILINGGALGTDSTITSFPAINYSSNLTFMNTYITTSNLPHLSMAFQKLDRSEFTKSNFFIGDINNAAYNSNDPINISLPNTSIKELLV
jgi:hypothetical protein